MSSTFDGDPRTRPMSEAPRSPPPAAFKTFGQVYQYAETFQNPYPEVIFSGNADGTATGGINGNNRTPAEPDTRSSIHPGTTGSKEPAMHESVWVEPADPPWYKMFSKWQWIIVILCTAGITGVVMAILGAMNKLSGDDRSDPTMNFIPGPPTLSNMLTNIPSSFADTTTTTSMSTSATSTMTATSTTTTSSSTTTKATVCKNSRTFFQPLPYHT